MDHRTCLTAAAVLGGVVLTAHALEGANGSVVTELFTVADVEAGVQYPTGFAGVAWADLDTFTFASPGGTSGYEQGDDMDADADGNLFLIVRGVDDGADRSYTGLVGWDGTNFTHLVQDELVFTGATAVDSVGDQLRTVTVSPATAGLLTAGHPVITRHHKTVETEVELEIASVDPATGAETFVFGWTTTALNPEAILAIADDGTIYALAAVNAPAGSIRKLSWNATTSSYDETVLTGADFGGGLTMGPDGYLYGFAKGDGWQTLVSPYDDHAVLRIDPASGSYTTWAHVDGDSFVFDWTWGSAGKLWIGLRQRRVRKNRPSTRYVAEVAAGGVASPSNRISDSTDDPRSVAAAPGGALYVMERAFSADGAVYLLEPGSGGDGGSGGGGKGGGKGKNK